MRAIRHPACLKIEPRRPETRLPIMKTMHQTLRLFSVLIGLWASSQTPLSAVNEKGDWPWNLKLNGWQDREVAEELGTGWFLNAWWVPTASA